MLSKGFTHLSVALFVCLFCATDAPAQLLIDFNSLSQDGGPHNQEGYQAYDAGHEVALDFVTKEYEAMFFDEEYVISLTPAWPNTTDNRVQQMIDRSPSFDANWLGDDLDLITDWLGIDSRTGNGGNGNWDLTEFTTPTYMTLTIGGLPAGTYNWLSLHHDTEHCWCDFQVEISTDDGFSYSEPIFMEGTDSTPAGNPASPMEYQGLDDPDPRNLPSTFKTSFTTNGDDVVFRFTPYTDGLNGVNVHKNIFGINGFELEGDEPVQQETTFIRGDTNADLRVNLADAIIILGYLFGAAEDSGKVLVPKCFDAADTNDDGNINLSDAITVLSYMFTNGPMPAPVFPNCGVDPTTDGDPLDCVEYPDCDD